MGLQEGSRLLSPARCSVTALRRASFPASAGWCCHTVRTCSSPPVVVNSLDIDARVDPVLDRGQDSITKDRTIDAIRTRVVAAAIVAAMVASIAAPPPGAKSYSTWTPLTGTVAESQAPVPVIFWAFQRSVKSLS